MKEFELQNDWVDRKFAFDHFTYPYGAVHSWDMARYEEMLPKTKGSQFGPAYTFVRDNDHVAVVTQSGTFYHIYLEHTALS